MKDKKIIKEINSLRPISLTIGFIAIVLLFVSILIKCSNEWLCDVLISVSGGLVAGLIVYFLGNLRTDIVKKNEDELLCLSKIIREAYELKGDLLYYHEYKCLYLEDIDKDLFMRVSIEKGNNIFEAIYGLDEKIYIEAGLNPHDIPDQLHDCADIENKYMRLVNIDDEPDETEYYNLLLDFADRMEKVIKIFRPLEVKRRKVLNNINNSIM